MMKKKHKILLVTHDELDKCPRPRRLFLELRKYQQVEYICRPQINELESSEKVRNLDKRLLSPFQRMLAKLAVKFGFYQYAVNSRSYTYDVGTIVDGEYDYLFVFHIYLLPLFTHLKKTKVIFDARECYPLQRANDAKWRATHGKLAEYICQKYIPQTYKTITVSPSLLRYYKRLTGKDIDYFPSYPRQKLFVFPEVDKPWGKQIRLIHHGGADSKRGLERLMVLMDLLGEEYHLDLMLVARSNQVYYEKLSCMAQERANVSMIDPVSPDEVIAFSSDYDFGVFIPPDNGSQNKFCLPNKYFEFLYAGLPVITSASEDMKELTEQFNLGIACLNEPVEEIAQKIKSVTKAQFQGYKKSISEVVGNWSLEHNIKTTFPEFGQPS